RQRLAMLNLFATPFVNDFLHIRTVGKYVAKIGHIVGRVELDHCRRLHCAKNIGIDLRRVEVLPSDIVECPVTAHGTLPCYSTALRAGLVILRYQYSGMSGRV